MNYDFLVFQQLFQGLPFVQIGSEFFNALSVERALKPAQKNHWVISLHGGGSFELAEDMGAGLIASFAELPFVPIHSLLANSEKVAMGPVEGYFNLSFVQRVSYSFDGLTLYIPGSAFFYPSPAQLLTELQSRLTRARLMNPGNPVHGGKR